MVGHLERILIPELDLRLLGDRRERLREAIEAVLATSAPAPPARRVLIHGDLGAEHVLVDADRITGVIDRGDAVIGDPAPRSRTSHSGSKAAETATARMPSPRWRS